MIKMGRQSIEERAHLKEKNDCTVRALMDSLEIPYLTAYGMLIGAGRKRYRGVHANGLYDNFAIASYPQRPNMTVENYVKFIAHTGNWIINTRGHVFAVVNGEIRDLGNVAANLGCHVIRAWRMK